MLVFGLTGGIAAGKSAVEALLRRRGVPVLDADAFARAVVEPGSPAFAEVVAAFGEEVLAPDGTLDRKALGAKVFADAEARRWLEAITHPRIREAMGRRIMELALEGRPYAVVSAALMVETGTYRDYAGLIVVTCRPEQQIARLMAREGLGEDEARARIGAQLPLAEKERLADFLVDNRGPRGDLEARVDALVGWMEARSGQTR